MNKYNLRYGDWVKDPSNYNYELRITESEMGYAEIFSPIDISGRFFDCNNFAEDTSTGDIVYFRCEGDCLVSIRPNEDSWHIEARNGVKTYFKGDVAYVNEVQHILEDCNIGWRITLK